MDKNLPKLVALAGLILLFINPGCGDDDDVPPCLQVISSCVDTCDIECPAGKVEACAGPGFGFDNITDNERCCFCTDP